MNKQGKGKIDWTDFTLNPILGRCKLASEHPWCYAVGMYDRFGWNPDVRLELREFEELRQLKHPAKIFVCSTHEFFGWWVPWTWRMSILNEMIKFPQHTFQILTECPENAVSLNFQDNIWLGVTVQSQKETHRLDTLRKINAKVLFASFEPLHSEIHTDLSGLDWIIIGAETGNRKARIKPEWSWVLELIRQADALNIPVFLKDNLLPHIPKTCEKFELRKEYPIQNFEDD